MPRLRYPWVVASADAIGLLVTLLASGLLTQPVDGWRSPVDAAALLGMFVFLWFAIAIHIGAYRVAPEHDLPLSIRRGLDAWGVTWGIGGIATITTVAPAEFSAWLALALGAAVLVSSRCLVALTPWLWSQDLIRAIVIGTHPTGNNLRHADSERTLQVIGIIPFTNEKVLSDKVPSLGTIAELPSVLDTHKVDVAVVSPSDAAVTGEVRSAFRTCNDRGVTVHYFPSLLDVDHERVRISWDAEGTGPDIATMTSPKRALALAAKRAIDLVGAGIGCALLLPVFVMCALAIKLTSRGPVFFRQTRVGAGGRTFQCLKFRTMRVGAHAQQDLLRSASTQDGPAFKMPKDPRVTPIGRFLRKFSVDELPQLLNVLAGDMSLVGPRPPIPTEVERYQWWQRRRVSVKPGLTCLWQVYGRNRVSFKRWVEMDLYYIDNWSLWLDLKLIAHTFAVVMRGTGM